MGGVPGNGRRDRGSAAAQTCDLDFAIKLFGPVPGVVDGLQVDDMLDIELQSESGGPVVAVITRSDPPQRAGTLIGGGEVPDLVDCMDREFSYSATVKSKDGSEIWLHVRRA